MNKITVKNITNMLNLKSMWRYTFDNNISTGAKVLMNILILKASEDNSNCTRKYYRELAIDMDVSEKQVQRYVKELVDKAYITVEYNKKKGVRTIFNIL